MNPFHRIVFVMAAILFVAPAAGAQIVGSPGSELTDHPAVASTTATTAAAWRNRTGAWGETAAKKALRLRGYNQVYAPKLPGDRGIDLIAVRRGPGGTVTDARLVEVKTHNGYGVRQLSSTRQGRQMSDAWLRSRLNRMKTSSNPRLRTLADEIDTYRGVRNLSPQQMGEVIDINTNTGTYTIRDPSTRGMITHGDTADLFRNLKRNAPQYRTRRWAAKHLNYLDHIHGTNMTRWMNRNPRVSTVLPEASWLRGIRATDDIIAYVIPMAAAADVIVDGYEAYYAYSQYSEGKISRERMWRTHIKVAGGFIGAETGAITGAYIGGQVGTLGGPFAPVSATAGSIVGGVTGGIAGYMAGRAAGAYAADAWYDRLDETVKNDLDHWVRNTTYTKTGLGTQ